MFRHASHLGGLCCGLTAALLASTASHQDPQAREVGFEELVRALDLDGDQRIAPYEGADALLRLLETADKNEDGGVNAAELESALAAAVRAREEDAAEMHAELDADGNGVVQIATEVPEEYRAIARAADADADGALSAAELARVEMNPGETAEADAASLFTELDRDSDGRLTAEEVPEDEWNEALHSVDANGDEAITLAELEDAFRREDAAASFVVDGGRCVMTGVIGPNTPARVLELICEHPQVEVIEMRDVPGSMDDTSNLRAARMIRRHGLATHLPADGVIASGGVDFFLAGAQRTVASGGRLGVHSWAGPNLAGADLPRDHPEHQMFVEFYEEMGTPESFYWYTLEAARPEDIHWMTPDEMTRFQIASPGGTEPPMPAPVK